MPSISQRISHSSGASAITPTNTSLPLSTTTIPGKGRCYVANRFIKQGQVILSASPFACIPDTQSSSTHCFSCLQKKNNLRICCKYASFCDNCENIEHCCELINNCNTTTFDDYTHDYFRLLVQCILRGLNNDIYALCDNEDMFSDEKRSEFMAVAEQLSLVNGDDIRDMFLLVCKEECNSFGMYYKTPNGRCGYGLALYPSAVYFNHSCVPNVVHVTEGVDQVFYAACDIDEGEELCISYIDIRQGVWERQEELERVFLFRCSCERCILECGSGSGDNAAISLKLDNVLCQRSGCKGIYLPTTRECEACHFKQQLK